MKIPQEKKNRFLFISYAEKFEPLILFLALFNPWIKADSLSELLQSTPQMLYSTAIGFFQIVFLLYFFRLKKLNSYDTGFRRFMPFDVIRTLSCIFFLFALAAALSMIFIYVYKIFPALEKTELPAAAANKLPVLFIMMLCTGYREELFFRSYMITEMTKKGNAVSALFISSLFFSAGHIYQGAAGIFISFILGLLQGGFFLKFRSIHINAIAHCFYNFILLAVSALSK